MPFCRQDLLPIYPLYLNLRYISISYSSHHQWRRPYHVVLQRDSWMNTFSNLKCSMGIPCLHCFFPHGSFRIVQRLAQLPKNEGFVRVENIVTHNTRQDSKVLQGQYPHVLQLFAELAIVYQGNCFLPLQACPPFCNF